MEVGLTMKYSACVFGLAVLALALPLRAELSTESLLGDLVDLDRLTRLPEPAYTTRQFSGYNLASKTPTDAEGWFGNRDRGYFLRTEQNAGRQEYVMMDAAGPGAIVRVWSATNKGTLRFYLAGSDTPVIEAPIIELLGGKFKGIPAPLSGSRARGWNLYFPIAYARGCKVTVDIEQVYYHINYRTYPAGTPVRSFEPADLTRCSARIAEIAQRLTSPRKAAVPPATQKLSEFDVEIAPDARLQLAEAAGPAVVCEFAVSLAGPAAGAEPALRACVLEMSFDDRRTVECPLGDFFGTAPGANAYESLPLGITAGPTPEMWSSWRMPFQRVASIHVRNLGPRAVGLRGRVSVAPGEFDARTCYFHAGWRIERDIPSRPFSDWTHLECTGAGRFVGGALNIMNPVRAWWGEGDEKIYVDGESFPSHFGTGTEDYYGYAWCSPQRFVHAYHNQPRCDGPGNYGHTSVNRFHIIDDIPFARSFRFDMENWHHVPITRTTRAAVSYWYARPGSTAGFPPIGHEQVAPVTVPPFEVPQVTGAIEGESLRVLAANADVSPSDTDERFSSGRHLLWRKARTQDRLQLGFDAAAEGDRRVWARLVVSPQAPRVQLHINGQPAGPEVDLTHYRVAPTEAEVDLGRHALRSGENRLAIEVMGPGARSPATPPAFTIGLDYLRVE
jgi:hypothetical protein